MLLIDNHSLLIWFILIMLPGAVHGALGWGARTAMGPRRRPRAWRLGPVAKSARKSIKFYKKTKVRGTPENQAVTGGWFARTTFSQKSWNDSNADTHVLKSALRQNQRNTRSPKQAYVSPRTIATQKQMAASLKKQMLCHLFYPTYISYSPYAVWYSIWTYIYI